MEGCHACRIGTRVGVREVLVRVLGEAGGVSVDKDASVHDPEDHEIFYIERPLGARRLTQSFLTGDLFPLGILSHLGILARS